MHAIRIKKSNQRLFDFHLKIIHVYLIPLINVSDVFYLEPLRATLISGTCLKERGACFLEALFSKTL